MEKTVTIKVATKEQQKRLFLEKMNVKRIPRAAGSRKETAQEEMLVFSPMKGFLMLPRPQKEPVGDPVRMLSQLERGSRASLLR
jgi:hypothetical protein